MSTIRGLKRMVRETEKKTQHEGYWYSVGDALIIMVCGMLCGLQTIGDVHEWSKAGSPRAFGVGCGSYALVA